jgi:hypothetical protein
MARIVHVATIQVAIEVDTPEEACDWISGLFDRADQDPDFDWGYVCFGGQYLYPTEHVVPEDWNISSLDDRSCAPTVRFTAEQAHKGPGRGKL